MSRNGEVGKKAVRLKRVFGIIGIALAVLLLTQMVRCGVCFYYETYHVATRCEAESPDGEYTLLFKSIGQPP